MKHQQQLPATITFNYGHHEFDHLSFDAFSRLYFLFSLHTFFWLSFFLLLYRWLVVLIFQKWTLNASSSYFSTFVLFFIWSPQADHNLHFTIQTKFLFCFSQIMSKTMYIIRPGQCQHTWHTKREQTHQSLDQ